MLSEIDYRNVVTFDLVSYVSLNSAIETRRRFKATVRCVGISLQNYGIKRNLYSELRRLSFSRPVNEYAQQAA
jgi:hypothetical protein